MGDGRGVVDPVADHRHDEVARLEAFDRRGLVVGPGLGFDPIRGDAKLAGHGLRGRPAIAGHEPDLDPAVVERPDRCRRRRLERVAERDLSGERAIDRHPGDRLPGDLGERGGGLHARAIDTLLGQESTGADEHRPRPIVGVDRPGDAGARDGLEVGDPAEAELDLVRPGDDRGPERVLAALLE